MLVKAGSPSTQTNSGQLVSKDSDSSVRSEWIRTLPEAQSFELKPLAPEQLLHDSEPAMLLSEHEVPVEDKVALLQSSGSHRSIQQGIRAQAHDGHQMPAACLASLWHRHCQAAAQLPWRKLLSLLVCSFPKACHIAAPIRSGYFVSIKLFCPSWHPLTLSELHGKGNASVKLQGKCNLL